MRRLKGWMCLGMVVVTLTGWAAAGEVRGDPQAGHPRILILGGANRNFVPALTAQVKAEFPAASFAHADVEETLVRMSPQEPDQERTFGWMRDWKPDAAVMAFDANGPKADAVKALRSFLANDGKTKFLSVGDFDRHPGQDAQTLADRIWDRLEPLISFKGPMHLYGPVNYDPEKIEPYTLEDPLTFADGTPVRSTADWTKRRTEILDLFAREMYGQPPPPPEAFVWEVVSERIAFAGFARFRHVRTWFKADKSGPSINWYVFLPRFAKQPVPPILLLNYRGISEYVPDEDMPLLPNRPDLAKTRGRYCNPNETSYCPLPVILAKGYAFMTACYGEVSPDPFPCGREVKIPAGQSPAYPYVGVFDLWPKRDESRTDNTTALGAWAWALSRGLDLAERMADTDGSKAVVAGCSRLGKAAFLAAARDERFKVCVVNQSGGGGVTLTKRNLGEAPKTEMKTFRHWFCAAYDKYVEDPRTQPFDQHLFVATIAPRALLVQGFDDFWYDTEGEYLSCKAASPVWKFLGGTGLPDHPFPEEHDTSCIGVDLGYVRRFRHHGLSAHDWVWLLDFADKALKK